MDNVLHNLALDGRNLRVLFQQYDSKSYGYLTVDQVIVLLCMPADVNCVSFMICFKKHASYPTQKSSLSLSSWTRSRLAVLIIMHYFTSILTIDRRNGLWLTLLRFYQTPGTITRRRAWMHSKQHTIR